MTKSQVTRLAVRRLREGAGLMKPAAAVLKQYGVSRVCGDRYAGTWPADAFLKAGIVYETSTGQV